MIRRLATLEKQLGFLEGVAEATLVPITIDNALKSLSKKHSAPSLRTQRLCGELVLRGISPPSRRVRGGYAERKRFPTNSNEESI